MSKLNKYSLMDDQSLLGKIVSETVAEKFSDLSYDLEEIFFETEEEELLEIPGIGPKKIEQISAIKESVKRVLEKKRKDVVTIGSPTAAVEYNQDIKNMKVEEVRCLMLNTKSKVIGQKVISTGTISKSLVNPREFFSTAIRKMAAGCVFIHNHPSGVVEPSKEDKAITKKLKEAGDILGIKLIDAIIIGSNDYFSFKEEGKLIW